MGTLYVDTGGSATNSGSSDNNAADLSGSAATVAAAVVSLDGSPDLSGVSTSGATQATIYLNDATNSNQKIFWITAVDNVLKTVTVSVAPTGVTSSVWAIGGRFVWTPASIESALRAGDKVVINNSPASTSAAWITGRSSGDVTSGSIKVQGKTGVRPTITVTNTNNCLNMGTGNVWIFSNIELVQQGASGTVTNVTGTGNVYYNIKISDGGGNGIFFGAGGNRVIASEVSGIGGDGLNTDSAAAGAYIGNYVHDVTGDGFDNNNGSRDVIANNIFDTCAARGIYSSSGAQGAYSFCMTVIGNTVYGCGNTGFEVAANDHVGVLMNNIFSENGNAAGEFNVEWVSGAAEYVSFHGWNVFYHSGGGGGANLSGLTVNAQVASSEFTTDPAFTNAAGGDFSIGSTSPAKATGYPGAFLGGSTGYLDIGAVQRQEAGGGGGGLRLAGHGGLAA